MPKLENVEIEDTFAEGFKMWISRVLITAATQKWALIAARTATGFGTSIIMSPAEAAIEKVVSPEDTVDGRPGVIIQICHTKKKLLAKQLLLRLGQCVLTCPTTAAFCAMDDTPADELFKTGANLRYFGDGFEEKVNLYGRDLWKIPVMEGEFLIDSEFGGKKGVAGGNLLLIGDDPEQVQLLILIFLLCILFHFRSSSQAFLVSSLGERVLPSYRQYLLRSYFHHRINDLYSEYSKFFDLILFRPSYFHFSHYCNYFS